MKDYIKKTYNTDRKEHYLFNQIPVFILNELPSNINVKEIINILEDIMSCVGLINLNQNITRKKLKLLA